MGSLEQTNIGFIGLGAMGLGMATDLQRRGQYSVTGFDIWQPSLDKFVANGGQAGKSPADVAKTSRFLICMAATAQQLDSILFDSSDGAIEALPKDATVILCSTVPPTYYDTLPCRIANLGRPDIQVVDAPVSGGTLRAAKGKLSIFAAGSSEALSRATDLLDDMSESLYIITGGLGAGSKIKMINQLLVGTHIAAACEAVGFATKAGLNPREVFEILQNTAGSSWAWNNRVPHILESDWTPLSALNIFVKDMGIVVSTSRAVQFPLPIASVAEQLYISGSAQGYGKEDDAGLVRLFLQGTAKDIPCPSYQNGEDRLAYPSPQSPVSKAPKVALIGLDSVSSQMALLFAGNGLEVHVFDADVGNQPKPLFANRNISHHDTPVSAATNAEILVLREQGRDQVTELLLDNEHVANVLAQNAVVILSSTSSPSYIRSLEGRLTDLDRGIALIDAPICHGVSSKGDPCVTMIYSGSEPAISRADPLLLTLKNKHVFDTIRRVSGRAGAASTVKLIDQQISGIQILAASEAMAFAAKLGLNPTQMYELVGSAAAWSWMLQTRVPKMVNQEWNAKTDSVGTLVNDLSLFMNEAKESMFWAPLALAAHNIFLSAATKGWAGLSDACVVRLYETDEISVSRAASTEIDV